MLSKISQHLKEKIQHFSDNDTLIFNNKTIDINKNNFVEIKKENNSKSIAFIDGGQAEILSAGNFCLSFIRVAALIFSAGKDGKEKEIVKKETIKKEFYLLTTAGYYENEIHYESKMFGDKLIDESDLFISSNDTTIKNGTERAPINKVSNMARRFAELALAAKVNADFILIDGTLEKTFKNEEKYLHQLPTNVSALAKSSSLFTTQGNSPVVLLNKLSDFDCWSYFVEGKTFFAKLSKGARHIFRFEGEKEALPALINNSNDALFLGYPYGLIAVDKIARVSNTEKNSLKMKFLLQTENKEIAEYLNSANAHDILDNLG